MSALILSDVEIEHKPHEEYDELDLLIIAALKEKYWKTSSDRCESQRPVPSVSIMPERADGNL